MKILKKIPINLCAYLLGHFIWQAIFNPKQFGINIKSAIFHIKEDGLEKSRIKLLSQYLPKIYLLKTKLHIKEPSFSIYKKISPYLAKNYFTPPKVETSDGIATKPRILVIRTGAMGDVLLTTPIIRKLYQDRNGFCEIHVATRNPEIFENSPYVLKTLTLKELRTLSESYDLILNLDMALEKNKAAHITDAYYFYAFGSKNLSQNLQPEIFSTEQDKAKALKFHKEFGAYMVCHNRVDPSQRYRNVPQQQWSELLNNIAKKHAIKILQIGLPGIDLAIHGHPNFIDVRGKFSAQELKELISHAELFLGTDAGPLHIAACTNVPIVSFFTLAHHETRKPLRAPLDNLFKPITPGISCYGCVKDYPLAWSFKCQRGDFACTTTFDIAQAENSCLDFLARHP